MADNESNEWEVGRGLMYLVLPRGCAGRFTETSHLPGSPLPMVLVLAIDVLNGVSHILIRRISLSTSEQMKH